MDEQVIDPRLGYGAQIDRAFDPRDAPEILIFQIAAVRPAMDADRHDIAAGLQKPRDAELGRQLGVRGVPDPLPVDPHPVRRARRTDVKDHILAAPPVRQIEVAAIGTGLIVVMRDERTIGGKGKGDVVVYGRAIALGRAHRGGRRGRPL